MKVTYIGYGTSIIYIECHQEIYMRARMHTANELAKWLKGTKTRCFFRIIEVSGLRFNMQTFYPNLLTESLFEYKMFDGRVSKHL